MKNQDQHTGSSLRPSDGCSQGALKRTDKAVLKYLDEMTRAGNGKICIVSIPKIASACEISRRQVQISTKRLIEAGLIARLGYDFSNPDRAQRGTIYKPLIYQDNLKSSAEKKRKSIKLLLLWSED